jgi:hypothetical protein
MLRKDAETSSNIPATEAVLYTIKGGKHALPGGIRVPPYRYSQPVNNI